MITKDDVRDYLRRVQEKAINAIREKHADRVEKAWLEFLQRDTDIRDMLDLLQSACNDYSTAAQLANEIFPDGYWSYTVNDFTDKIKACVRKDDPDIEYAKAYSAWMEEVSSVREEYKKLFSLIDACKNGKKAADMLASYGFDISWLEEGNPKAVNKDLLFPCKENGL